jgi:hypothetical protein
LTQGPDGFLYGVATGGTGGTSFQVIFQLSTSGSFTELYQINKYCTPKTGCSKVLPASDGNLWIADPPQESVYSITKGGVLLQTVSFSSRQPAYAHPQLLIQASSGILYGQYAPRRRGLPGNPEAETPKRDRRIPVRATETFQLPGIFGNLRSCGPLLLTLVEGSLRSSNSAMRSRVQQWVSFRWVMIETEAFVPPHSGTDIASQRKSTRSTQKHTTISKSLNPKHTGSDTSILRRIHRKVGSTMHRSGYSKPGTGSYVVFWG